MRQAVLDAVVPAPVGNYRDDLLSGFTQLPLGSTVARIRGKISWSPSAFAAAQGIRVGIRVHGQSIASTALGPVTDEDADWMYYEPFLYQDPGSGVGTVANLQDQSQHLRSVVDVKSMRKLQELDSTLWLYAETFTGLPVSSLSWDLSVLLMLP